MIWIFLFRCIIVFWNIYIWSYFVFQVWKKKKKKKKKVFWKIAYILYIFLVTIRVFYIYIYIYIYIIYIYIYKLYFLNYNSIHLKKLLLIFCTRFAPFSYCLTCGFPSILLRVKTAFPVLRHFIPCLSQLRENKSFSQTTPKETLHLSSISGITGIIAYPLLDNASASAVDRSLADQSCSWR